MDQDRRSQRELFVVVQQQNAKTDFSARRFPPAGRSHPQPSSHIYHRPSRDQDYKRHHPRLAALLYHSSLPIRPSRPENNFNSRSFRSPVTRTKPSYFYRRHVRHTQTFRLSTLHRLALKRKQRSDGLARRSERKDCRIANLRKSIHRIRQDVRQLKEDVARQRLAYAEALREARWLARLDEMAAGENARRGEELGDAAWGRDGFCRLIGCTTFEPQRVPTLAALRKEIFAIAPRFRRLNSSGAEQVERDQTACTATCVCVPKINPAEGI
jgi:hypothetical protein